MNTDIRIDIRLPRHWKYRKLKRAIGTAPMEYLIVFWGTVAEQKPDGNLIGWASADIEDAAGWDGEPGVFCAAMMAVGFLDETETGFLPHDWADHQPWAVGAEERSKKARSAAKAKWGKTSKEEKSVAGKKAASARWGDKNEKPDDAECMLDACSMHAECVPSRGDAPSPSPLPKPKPLTTEEEDAGARARMRMPLSEISQLHVQYLGKIPDSQPVVTTLQDLVRHYPPDRLKIAFQAVVAAEKPNLNWIRTYLDNPVNWHKAAERAPVSSPLNVKTSSDASYWAEGTTS